jgi:ribosomal protein S18 acetylase RimI-like enzyme
MDYRVVPMDESRIADFYRLHSVENGFGWCFCVAWHVPTWEGWAERSAGQNRALRDELFYHHEYDGYLLYHNDIPVGWCQVGPRDRLEKLRKEMELDEDPDIWAITCFCIAPAYRGRHFADMMMEKILADMKTRGVKCAEGYPRHGGDLGPGEVWTGPEAVFIKAGFEIECEGRKRMIYRKFL